MLPDKPTGRFSRQQRLLKASEFKYVFARPIRSGAPSLSVLARPNGLTHARLGLAVPKREVKKAVSRNRIKRLIRESFRQHQQQLSGLDIVVLVRSDAARLNNAELMAVLKRQWEQLKKKCENSLSS